MEMNVENVKTTLRITPTNFAPHFGDLPILKTSKICDISKEPYGTGMHLAGTFTVNLSCHT